MAGPGAHETENDLVLRPPSKGLLARMALVVLTITALLVARPALNHAAAAGVLLRVSGGADTLGLRDWRTVPIKRETISFPVQGTPAQAYRYSPVEGLSTVGIVLVHGVHYRGMDEERLARFAEAIAKTGITVLTPHVPSLADYRIDHAAVVEIGAAAHELRHELGEKHPVGVMGVSFAGSLALLAATDPEWAADIAYVVTVGSYDDLGRVCRFYATGSIERPDGTVATLRPHEYGPVVWVYAHLEDFFPPDGIEDVREVLKSWLHEEKDQAREAARHLPDAARAKLEALFAGDFSKAVPDLAADVDRHAKDLDALSPHGHLDALRVAVFALHGSDDHLIPPSETLWLAHDVPPGMLAFALITRALTHVEIGEQATFAERFQTIHFMAGILAAARHASQ